MSSHDRHIAMLTTAFGPEIANALNDPDTQEVMANPDGSLWVETRRGGREKVAKLPSTQAERIIRLVASHVGTDCTPSAPVVSAELPGSGERFEGLLPPAAPAPCFAIRKPAARVFSVEEFVEREVMTPMQATILRKAVATQQNIVIAGGTGSGKTTLANALLHEFTLTGERLVLIEDTRELQCTAQDHVQLRTVTNIVSMCDLVRSSLRLRPDRIIIGEVRGAEALDLLKAWNTGHPGGVATLHANSADGALVRLEQLCGEATTSPPRSLIAEAVDMIAFLKKTGSGRRLTELKRVTGLTALEEFVTEDAMPSALTLIDQKETRS
ncbi:P-type conjugative transfer ATPase TrbB [Parvularcula sp. IMCC14364]|uniref:P-type conjugative transfer ATPase TrbB n=1 Tax=Parvularcula sp. IMCC14364 TaxID=3067902 RepID=UPI0027419E9A|nr:P-type conjugative transfer ATPase TrbB [Parvularcula sp. IMCC14364]